jgi:hypothetical protein
LLRLTSGPGPGDGAAPADHALAYRGRIAREGRGFIARSDGFAFTFRGASELLLLHALLDPARGDDGAAEAHVAERIALRRRQGFSVLRVLGMLDRAHEGQQLRLRPVDGDYARYQDRVRRLLLLAKERGVYIEWVLFADGAMPRERMDAHVDFAAALAQSMENTFVEVADEGWRSGLTAEDILRLGQRFKARAPDVQLAGTSAQDGGGAYGQAPFDYVTVHALPGGEGDGGWRWVQRIADGERIGAATARPVVQDQPIGSAAQAVAGQWDSAPERFRAAALLSHVTRQYFTFHHACALSPTASAGCQEVPTPGAEEIHRSDLLPADVRDGKVFDGAPAESPWEAAEALKGGVLRLATRLLGDGTGFYTYPLRVSQDSKLTLRKGTTLTLIDVATGAARGTREYADGEALTLRAGDDVIIAGGKLPPPPPPPEPVPAQGSAADVMVRTYTAAQATTIVHRLYQAILGRMADPSGLSAYQPLVAGGRLPRVTSALVTSAEFEGRRPSLNVPRLSSDLYQAILGRAPDAGGDAGTQEAIRRGQTAQRAADMVLSPEYEANRL